MSQTGKIFGALLVGFLVYVTLLGHLPQYFALLWKKGGSGLGNFGSGIANPGGAPVPDQENVPGGGSGIFGNQNAGGGYTPDPLSPNVLINNDYPSPSFGGYSLNHLIRQARGNLLGGAAI